MFSQGLDRLRNRRVWEAPLIYVTEEDLSRAHTFINDKFHEFDPTFMCAFYSIVVFTGVPFK
jgi:hypothetical protein